MLGQRIAIVLGVLGLTALPGCYGSTEPATDVGPESATLQGHGTADKGPARSGFQYWLTGVDRIRASSPGIQWPSGASGPFHERVTGLAAGRSYSFRLCGRDESAETVCAQTRTFTTKDPVEDALMGYFYGGCCSRLEVNAHSGPTGQNPRGNLYWIAGSSSSPPPHDVFNGFVTCLAVDGQQAAVGAVGQWQRGSEAPRAGTVLLTVVDRVAQADTINIVEAAGSTRPDCAGASFANQGQISIPDHELIVNDAPGSIPG